MAKKSFWYVILLFLLLADFGYSFLQYLHEPLDGDLAWNIVPSEDVKPIFQSPLGFKAVIEQRTYANPNRFFSHWTLKQVMEKGPQWLQFCMPAIDSPYWASALFKIVVHIALVFFLAGAIVGYIDIKKIDFVLVAVLISPFFQTHGYKPYMGIIDTSISYTFFYAFPLLLLMVCLWPMFVRRFHSIDIRRSRWDHLFRWLLAITVCLSGPLNPGIILTLAVVFLLHYFYTVFSAGHTVGQLPYHWSVSDRALWAFLVLLSVYSLYLGRYNSLTLASEVLTIEMYAKLPAGLWKELTEKLGVPLLLLFSMFNTFLLRRYCTRDQAHKYLVLWNGWLVFSVLYILLLPLGGYRDYRPLIVRYDTLLPVTVGLVFYIGATTFFLLKNLSAQQRKGYVPVVLVVLFVFTWADKAEWSNNRCERSSLQEISASDHEVVPLAGSCSVLDWRRRKDPRASYLNARLLTIWGLTKKDKLYYHPDAGD